MDITESGYTVFITSNRLGTGDERLGELLIKAFLNCIWQARPRPERIILMNNGVKLGIDGSDALETLALLEKDGVDILSCGTCLAYYNLTERLKAGRVSNMHEIVDALLAALRVIRI